MLNWNMTPWDPSGGEVDQQDTHHTLLATQSPHINNILSNQQNNVCASTSFYRIKKREVVLVVQTDVYNQ